MVADSWESIGQAKPLSRRVAMVLVALFVIQCALNFQRSMRYRHDLGQVMVAVDQAYDFLNRRPAGDRLALLSDFRPYDYRPDAPALFREKQVLGDANELVSKAYPENKTWVVSWKPSLWERLEVVEHYSGCRPGVLMDFLYPCTGASGVWLMRFIAADPEYAKGEALRAKGDLIGARKLHESFLARHPMSPAGFFVVGLESYELRDFARAEQAYGWLESAFPDHLSILYNHALAYEGLGRLREAMPRLEASIAREPRNYGALLHLYWDYRNDGQADRARGLLVTLRREFPEDAEVKRLAAGSP
jgi:tetratricopeptide (TPR) repeat protein